MHDRVRSVACAVTMLWLAACSNSPAAIDARSDAASGDHGALVDSHASEAGARPDSLPHPDGPKPPAEWKVGSGAAPNVASPCVTLLQDGRVLVAGGWNWPSPNQMVDTYQKTAWLFQPDTNTFVSAGEMKQARGSHTCSLLPDGRVLIAGGYDGDNALDSTEIFDPAQPVASAWSSGPSMAGGRMGHSAVTLTDGRIVIAGGYAYPAYLGDILIYKPNPGSFQIIAVGLGVPRDTMAASLISNGKVLLAGGDDGSSAFSNVMETFDPATGNVAKLTTTMSDMKSGARAFTLASGKVFITAGYSFAAGPRDDLYDPGTDTVVPITHPGGSARGSAATMLLDNRVLVAGGFEQEQSTKVRVFSEVGMSWDMLPDLLLGRSYSRVITLQDGSVLAVGGQAYDDSFPAEAERLYNP